MSVYAAALAGAIRAVQKAGAVLRSGLNRPEQAVEHLTESERMLREDVRSLGPWSCSSKAGGFQPGEDPSHVWLLTPDDAPEHYAQGRRGTAICLALIRQGIPVLGVVYAHSYPGEEGDWIAWAEGDDCLTRNGETVPRRSLEGLLKQQPWDSRMIVYLSPELASQPRVVADCIAPARFITLPSLSYRLGLVACGEGIAAVSLNETCSFDYAAGDALLRGAGAVLLNEAREGMNYSPTGASVSVRCFGGYRDSVEDLGHREWSELSASLPVGPAFEPARVGPGRRVTEAGLLARAQGCLLGQFAGDSLGGLVEFRSASQIRAKYPQGLRELADGGTWHNMAGQLTDDSELACLLARAIVQANGYDEALVLSAYADWVNDPQTFDIGTTTSRALRAFQGTDTHEQRLVAIQERAAHGSESNGSLMRCSPIGLLMAGNPEGAAELARRDSRLTHPHAVCQDSCAAFCAALAVVLTSGDREAAYAVALSSVTEEKVRATLEAARHGPPLDFETNMGHVVIALQNAFYQLLHADSLEEGIVQTVMAGGDTDTNGAIAGALLGAAYGRDAVPARWVRALLSCRPQVRPVTSHPRAREYWPVEVFELAEAVLAAGR